jgi:hypothetical protein
MQRETKTVTDSVIDGWVQANRGMKCGPASQVCRGMEMQYRLSDGKTVRCVVEKVGPLMEDGLPSGVTIRFHDEAGVRHERNTLVERLILY